MIRCGHCGQTFEDSEAHTDHLSREGWFESMRQSIAHEIEVAEP